MYVTIPDWSPQFIYCLLQLAGCVKVYHTVRSWLLTPNKYFHMNKNIVSPSSSASSQLEFYERQQKPLLDIQEFNHLAREAINAHATMMFYVLYLGAKQVRTHPHPFPPSPPQPPYPPNPPPHRLQDPHLKLMATG